MERLSKWKKSLRSALSKQRKRLSAVVFGLILLHLPGHLFSGDATEDLLRSADSLLQIKQPERVMETLSVLQPDELSLGDYSRYLNIHSQALFMRAEFDLAYREALETYKLAMSINDSLIAGRALITAGNVDMRLRQSRQALAHYEHALKTLPVQGDHQDIIAGIKNNQAIIYRQLNQKERSGRLHREVLQIRMNAGDSAGMSGSLNNIGSNYFDRHLPDSAKYYFKMALELKKALNDLWGIGNAYNNLALCCLESGDIDSALIYGERGLDYGWRSGSLLLRKNSNSILSRAYRVQGDPDKAYLFLEQTMTLKDSLFDIGKAEQINEMKIRFETEKKEKENQILRAQQALSDASLARQRLMIFTVFLLLVLVSAAALFLMYRNRMNQELRRRERELHEKTQSMMEAELSHRERELSSKALMMVQKNELMLQLLKDLDQLAKKYDIPVKDLKSLYREIETGLNNADDWSEFQRWYESSSNDFLGALQEKYPDLTTLEVRLSALIRLNFSTKEVASLMNRSPEAVEKARNRLRKKLGIEPGVKLNQFLASIE